MSHVGVREESNWRLVYAKARISQDMVMPERAWEGDFLQSICIQNAGNLCFFLGEVVSCGICTGGKIGHPGPLLQIPEA